MTAVAKELQEKSGADVKDIYLNLAKDLTNSDSEDETLMEKISDAVKLVTKEVLEGIEDVGQAIKDHPEMIAE